MLPRVHIPVRPSSEECLAWSPDGELAIAVGEEVYLLIPQFGSPEPWTHVRITVSSFTSKEWPWQESASFRDMSIGEEQARATVTALAWSPPGLAKHRRSVLAVLTSNLILSLWASHANSTHTDSWERILVVNKALSRGSRPQKRIRSMAWAPTDLQHVDRQTPYSWRKWGIPLIAIADDSNGLYILKVSSPFTGQSFEWRAEVLRHHSVPVSNQSNDRPSLLSLVMNANHYVDRIEFGTWKGDISVMYRTSGIIHYASISICEDHLSRVRPEDFSDRESPIVNFEEVCAGKPNMPSRNTVTPVINAQMTAEKEKYGLDNKLGNHVTLRRWGLASFNEMVAACITLHPAKMVEYIAPFDGIATVLFDDAGEGNGDANSVFPWQSPVQVDVAKVQRAILDTVFDQTLHWSLALSNLDLKIIYAAFCGNLLLSDDKRLERLQAAEDILELIEHQTSINLSAEHRVLLSLKESSQLTDQELMNAIGQMTGPRCRTESSLHATEKALLDFCPFCPEAQSIIPFDNFAEAYCPQGHYFGGCFPL